MTAIKGLGNDFDVLHCWVPVDLGTAGATGARINMENYGRIAFCAYLAVGTAAENPTFTLYEHTAATSGTSTALAVIDEYFEKVEATLDGDETWTRVTQTAASTVTDTDWDDAGQVLVQVASVGGEELSDGYEWVSLDADDPGTAHLSAGFAIGTHLKAARTPANLPQPNA